MASHSVQCQLDTIESQINQFSQSLFDPAAGDLLQAASSLQTAVLELSRLMQRGPTGLDKDPSLKVRVRKISVALTSCREALMRRAYITQSALSTLMPATRDATYAPAAGKYARQPYGSAGRQSGEFRVVRA